MSQFDFLMDMPELYRAMTEVERRIDNEDWEAAVQKMRTALQELIRCFFSIYGTVPQGSLDEQINMLFNAGLISSESASVYHKLRMLGNRVSHENTSVKREVALGAYKA